jgi:hypothetical protein
MACKGSGHRPERHRSTSTFHRMAAATATTRSATVCSTYHAEVDIHRGSLLCLGCVLASSQVGRTNGGLYPRSTRNDSIRFLLACTLRGHRFAVGSGRLTGARSKHGPRQLLDRYGLDDEPLVDPRRRDKLVVLDPVVVVAADLHVVPHGAVLAAADLIDERVGLSGS